jgi:hypothetical protein
MTRISRGWRLTAASWALLREDAGLMWLSVASTLSIVIFATAVLVPTWRSGLARTDRTESYLALALVYFVSSFLAAFFNAAIVAAATDRMEGGQGSVAGGLRTAWARVDRLILWACLSASVGLVLRATEERAGFVGAIAARLIGVAWSVMTFLVVPVIVFEPGGALHAVRRSAHLFHRRWGEQLVGNGSIGMVTGLAGGVLLVFCLMLDRLSPGIAWFVGVIGLGALIALSSTLTGIFNAALYRYAVTGESRGPFDDYDLSDAFRSRGGSQLWRPSI